MTETLNEFLLRRFRKSMREFERLTTYKWDDLKIGTHLIMLRNGFGGTGGEHRVVSEIHDKYRMVVDPNKPEQRSLVYENCPRHHGDLDLEHWTEFCYILTTEDLDYKAKCNWREWRAYIYDKTGYDFR